MSKIKGRKDPKTIIDQIYNELEKGGTKTTNQIAVKMKANTQTVKRWVDLVRYIQTKPKLMVESGDRITLVRIDREVSPSDE
ncbi:MAG TPA: hypothetical protein VKM55_01085 [Candidatus Lokiarchaeia archaeon]|nr:hypothetical protein [Candidatus Lokiarchaeia archaeon]